VTGRIGEDDLAVFLAGGVEPAEQRHDREGDADGDDPAAEDEPGEQDRDAESREEWEEAIDAVDVRFSELFSPGKETLVIYSFMFPRSSGDTRPGPSGGETGRLPLAETSPACSSE